MDQGSTSMPSPEVAARRAIRVQNAQQRAQEAEKLKLQGNECFKKGNYFGAADLYAQAVNIHGPKPVLMANLAAAYLKLEIYEEVEWASTISLEYDPTSVKSRFRRAIARRRLNRLEAAKTDLEEILCQDPANASAKEELRTLQEGIRSNPGVRAGPFDKHPSYHDAPWELLSESETEDCKHVGNGTSCRFYNKGKCERGSQCKFSHAPDIKSVRDELGKNVCVHALFDDCAFGAQCLYSHSQTHLPTGVWWNNPQQLRSAKAVAPSVEKWSDYYKLHELLVKIPMARTYASLRERKAVQSQLTLRLDKAKALVQSRQHKPKEKPFVLVLSFEHDSSHLTLCKHLFSALAQNAKPVYIRNISWASQTLEYLDSPSLTSVLITDPGILKRRHARVVQKLIEYTKNGGRVVIGGLFSGLTGPLDFNKFMQTWGLEWKFGSYFRSTFSVNPSNQIVQDNPSLHESYSMKAVHISNIEPEAAIYKGINLSTLSDASKREAPVVCAPVGRGLLCYLGDTNTEDESTNTVLAMLGVLDTPPNPNIVQASKTTPLPPKITDKFLLILELEGDDHYKRVFAHQLSELEKRITVKFAYESDYREINTLLQSNALYGVYIVDEGIQNVQSMGTLRMVGKYASEGGLVVFGGLFAQNMDKEAFSFIFEYIGLPWKYGSTGTCEAKLNRRHEMAIRYPDLSEAFLMDAVHIRSFSPGDDLYKKSLDTEERRQQANSTEHSPILRRRLGQGHVGYIGGVGAPPEVLLAMFDLPVFVPLKELVPDSSKFIMILTGKDGQNPNVGLSDLVNGMKKKVEVVLGNSVSGLSNARTIELLPSQDLIGVLIMDAHIILPENAYLLSKLVEYSKAGGTVVFASAFASRTTPTQFNNIFRENWDLDWEMKSVDEQVELKRNFESPLFQGKKAKDIKAPKTARLKGIHVQGIRKSMAVYFPATKNELWNPDNYTSSIVYAEVADGHLGFLGTSKVDGEVPDIIYAMFGLI